MSNFLKIDKNLNIKNGIDIMEMSNIFMKLSKDDPNATLNLDDNFIILNEIKGEIIINIDSKKSKKIILDGSKTQILVPNGSIINLNNDEKSLTIQFSPSGKVAISEGKISDLREKPKYINDVHKKVDEWLWNGETGSSSKAIVQHLFLIPNNLMNNEEVYTSTPRDSHDYSRCLKMLDAIPELMPKLSELANINDDWKKLMEKEDNGLSVFENNLLKVKENIDKFKRKEKSQPRKI